MQIIFSKFDFLFCDFFILFYYESVWMAFYHLRINLQLLKGPYKFGTEIIECSKEA